MSTHIQVGFSNNIYDNPADIVGSVVAMSNHFAAIEIELEEQARLAVLDAPAEDHARLTRSLRDLAVARSLGYSVHAPWYGRETDLTAIDDTDRRTAIDTLARTIDFAAAIGAKVVTCHPGYNHHQTQPQLVDRLVESLMCARDLAGDRGVDLCVETMGAQRPSHTLLTVDSQLEVCRRAATWVCIDVPHVASVFPELPRLFDAIRSLAPVVRQVHLADMVPPSHRHLPIGRGTLPLEDILHHLEALGYVGHAIVEEFNRGWSPDEYLSAAIAFRDRIGQGAAISASGSGA